MIFMDKNVNYNKGLIFKSKFCQHFEIRNLPKQCFESQFLPRRKQNFPLQNSNDKDVKENPTNIKYLNIFREKTRCFSVLKQAGGA